jgi:hypothetical protein
LLTTAILLVQAALPGVDGIVGERAGVLAELRREIGASLGAMWRGRWSRKLRRKRRC